MPKTTGELLDQARLGGADCQLAVAQLLGKLYAGEYGAKDKLPWMLGLTALLAISDPDKLGREINVWENTMRRANVLDV